MTGQASVGALVGLFAVGGVGFAIRGAVDLAEPGVWHTLDELWPLIVAALVALALTMLVAPRTRRLAAGLLAGIALGMVAPIAVGLLGG
jgi:hypothetical protein